MIKSFRDKATAAIFAGIVPKGVSAEIAKRARTKLLMIDVAGQLSDLLVPPGNRLEALRGDRNGQHSIRVNDQFRLCFNWIEGNAENVEFVDYH